MGYGRFQQEVSAVTSNLHVA